NHVVLCRFGLFNYLCFHPDHLFPEKCGRNVNLCDVWHDFIDQVESIVRGMSGIERCSILYLHTVKSE
ncbi:hypothetical protein, partial [Vibrio parahaemolyticus]|uniref:hypothetical protein n=1 Tax=Vibrio parahaemolyticus TaxID=670 RepID=UPI001C601332